jgi:hypothetical protein
MDLTNTFKILTQRQSTSWENQNFDLKILQKNKIQKDMKTKMMEGFGWFEEKHQMKPDLEIYHKW